MLSLKSLFRNTTFKSHYIIEESKAFSSIDFVGQCLVDKERTDAFQEAINKTVKKNDIVLDLGTGSAIMAILAARAEAKKVYAIEFDPFIAETSKKNIETNKLEKIISLIIDDATKMDLPNEDKKINVVISEMLTTGMVDEPQVAAINNLHDKKLVDGSTIFLPCKQVTRISLINTDFSMFGIVMPMILHLWKWHKWGNLDIKKMTDDLLLNSISFNEKNNEEFETIITFKIKKSGIINSVYLTSQTFLTDKIFINDTEALNAPMLVPIEEITVEKGQELKLKISYLFGGGYKYFKVAII